MAAGEGFEPSQNDPESFVLPLHNPASAQRKILYHHHLLFARANSTFFRFFHQLFFHRLIL